ncbi:MAG: GNAT family N-acetyltransferase, partial [Thermomicrobiales bacterium]
VGGPYRWTDRLRWNDERFFEYLSRSTVRLFALYYMGTPIGYVELDAAPDGSAGPGTEIAYLGIFPAYHGRGLGKHLLSFGVSRAFDDGADRVWLHTCSLDGRHAISNYTARGFTTFRIDTEPAETSDSPG